MQDALGIIEAKASYDGPEHRVHVRVAEHSGNVYIDLANKTWQAVEITASGWQVVDHPPVKFRRAKAMLSLPLPLSGGFVPELRTFLNIGPDDWPLVVAWLLAAMRPRGPYPVLCLHGEQGSAKSTAVRVLRRLVDPNTAPLRSEPRDPRDLMIAANNGWMVTLDNVSHLPTWLSDALCRLSTGGGFSTRMLYENDEECIFSAMRPVIINGIEEVATRGDLLERSMLIRLPTIPEEKRLPEAKFWSMFDNKLPLVFGAMLSAVSAAIKNIDTATVEKLPRMADFALWATAGEGALGLQPGEFMASYTGNKQAGNELAVEASPVGKLLVDFMAGRPSWTGTATELLAALNNQADEKTRRLRSWPQSPRSLGGDLRRLAPNLRGLGLEVDLGRTKDKRSITLARIEGKSCVTTVTTVSESEKPGF